MSGIFLNRGNTLSHTTAFCFASVLLLALYLVEANQLWSSPDSSLEISFSSPSGYYDQDVRLTLTIPNSDADIIFTTDGAIPTALNSAVYSEPLSLFVEPEKVVILRARAILPGGEMGPIASASYSLGVESTLPMISLITDPADLWDAEKGIFSQPLERGIEWERPVEVFYVDQDRISGFHIPAGLRVHGGNSRKQAKKALRLYFRGEYGKPRLEYPLFPQSEVQSFKRLILHAGGSEYPYANTNGTLLRNPLMTSLSAQNNGLATYDRPALLFINGHLWGIYYVREYMNRHYWHDHYGEEFFGGYGEPWFKFFDFVRTHDLRDPDHYAYVQTQIDIENFIDYNILEFYGANFEWPHFNQFRYRPRSQGGRWHWVFWDEDLVFGMSPVVSVDYNMVKRILFDDDGEIATSALLLRKLMENPHFYALFLSRMVDLLNTSLAPEQVIAHIDALAVELESDIHYETRRWPSSSRWQTSVEGLRQFARLRPDILRQHFSDGFGLEGIVQLTIGQPTGNAGTVAVNDNLVDELPWQGVYYQGMAVRVTAVAGSGYRFSGWDSPDLPHSPVISLTLNMTRTITPVFTSARLEDLQPGDVIINRYGIDEVGEIEGDWIELVVNRPGGIDLRGWRLTDNDTKTATDEGSLIFGRNPALSTVRQGKRILIVATETASNDQRFPHDYLDSLNREIVLYVGNDNLDTDRDPWFNLGPNDNVALLAPGLTDAFHDDQGIAFVNVGRATSPSNITTPGFFGILQDGVTGGE